MGKTQGSKAAKIKKRKSLEVDCNRQLPKRKKKTISKKGVSRPLATVVNAEISVDAVTSGKSQQLGTGSEGPESVNNNAQIAVLPSTSGKSPGKSLRSRTIQNPKAKCNLDLDLNCQSSKSSQVATGLALTAVTVDGYKERHLVDDKESEPEPSAFDRLYRQVQANQKRREDVAKGDKGQPIPDMPASKKDVARLLPNNTCKSDEAVNLHDGIKMAVSPSDDEFYDTDSDMESGEGDDRSEIDSSSSELSQSSSEGELHSDGS